MVDYLLSFLEWMKIYLSWRLHPFEEKMWRKLLFFRHDRIPIFLTEVIFDYFAVISLTHKHLSGHHLCLFDIKLIKRGISKDRILVTKPIPCPLVQPFLLRIMVNEFSFQPAVNRFEMMYYIIIQRGLKFIWIHDLNSSFLPSSSDRFPFTQIYLNMHHLERKRFEFRVAISRTIKNQITRLHIFLSEPLIR